MLLRRPHRSNSEQAEEVRQLALARLSMGKAYNVVWWPWLLGIAAAIFSIGFVIYGISRERSKARWLDSLSQTRDAAASVAPTAPPPPATAAPAATERLIWVE